MRELNLYVTAFTWNALWQAPLIVLFAFGMTRVARACGVAWEHRIWVAAGMLELVVPGASGMPAGWLKSLPLWALQASTHDRSQITVDVGAWRVLQTLETNSFSHVGLPLLCGAVSTFAALRLLWLYTKTVRLQREAEPLELTGRAAEIWDICRERFELERVVVAECRLVAGPLTCGLRRPWLLLPAGLTSATEDADLVTIFAHELAHIQRKDFAKNLLYEVVALPLAWHPALWITRHHLVKSRECVCDDLAAAQCSERRSYARSLLRLASMLDGAAQVQPSHAIGIFDANTLEDRIMRLTEDVRPVSKVKRMLVAMACGIVATGVCAPAWAWGAHAKEVPAAAATKQEEVEPVRVGAGVMEANVESRVNPMYPPEAKAAGLEGSVVLDGTIGTDGSLTALKLLSGPPELAKAAWTAVSQWTWKPYLLNGVPTAVQTTVTVNFQLAP